MIKCLCPTDGGGRNGGKYENASQSTINGYRAAYNVCSKIYERKFRELKTFDLQDIIDNCDKNYPTYERLKSYLINYMPTQ